MISPCFTCRICNEKKPATEMKMRKDGRVRAECKACLNKKSREHYAKNKEKHNNRRREWYRNNREHSIQRAQKADAQNPEKKIIRNLLFRAIKQGFDASIVIDNDITIDAVMERDNCTCFVCGEKICPQENRSLRNGATIEHIVPISKGGLHEWSNVAVSHRKCNSAKGNKLEL